MRKFILGIAAALVLGGFGTASAKGKSKIDTYTGIVTSMTVKRDGSVGDIYIKLAGNVNTKRVLGCGMKNADHPSFNQFFKEKRLVYLTVEGDCFSNVAMKP